MVLKIQEVIDDREYIMGMLTTPLLIGGAPRSGTTALLQVLNSNPAVFISSEENLLNSIKLLGKLLGTRERRAHTLASGMRALSERETLTVDNIHSHNFSEKSVWPSIRYLYKWHHKRMEGGEPLVLWGDKFPNYFKEIDSVLALENVRYLHITRNPFDVVNSMLRRTEMSKQGKDWWKAITDIDGMINAWALAFQAIQNVESRPNVFHLHYESLVFDFDKTIFALNDFFGVDFTYSNIMVDDPEKHYERSFINAEVKMRISSNAQVSSYVEKFANNAEFPSVSTALRVLK